MIDPSLLVLSLKKKILIQRWSWTEPEACLILLCLWSCKQTLTLLQIVAVRVCLSALQAIEPLLDSTPTLVILYLSSGEYLLNTY